MVRTLAAILALILALSQALAQEAEDQAVQGDEYDLEDMEEEFNIFDEIPEENQEVKEEEVSVSKKILEANQWISGLLKEGDVALPKHRSAIKCKYNDCRWEKSPSGFVEVPYRISYTFPSRHKEVITGAMRVFHKNTCIRFVPYTNQKDFLDIMSLPGCWSYIGRMGGRQVVSLNLRSCVYHGVTQHELAHALGFYHEHTRSDRDKYVKINWEYVMRDAVGQFDKMDSNNLNTVYDYNSIMHYDKYAFTTTYGRETITPIPDPKVRVGARGSLSPTDIEKINKLYQCNM